MSDKITFTFSMSDVRMEVSCSEEFVSRQMERFEHVFLAWAEALGGKVRRRESGPDDQVPAAKD